MCEPERHRVACSLKNCISSLLDLSGMVWQAGGLVAGQAIAAKGSDGTADACNTEASLQAGRRALQSIDQLICRYDAMAWGCISIGRATHGSEA
jgi:hypothetical protein